MIRKATSPIVTRNWNQVSKRPSGDVGQDTTRNTDTWRSGRGRKPKQIVVEFVIGSYYITCEVPWASISIVTEEAHGHFVRSPLMADGTVAEVGETNSKDGDCRHGGEPTRRSFRQHGRARRSPVSGHSQKQLWQPQRARRRLPIRTDVPLPYSQTTRPRSYSDHRRRLGNLPKNSSASPSPRTHADFRRLVCYRNSEDIGKRRGGPNKDCLANDDGPRRLGFSGRTHRQFNRPRNYCHSLVRGSFRIQKADINKPLHFLSNYTQITLRDTVVWLGSQVRGDSVCRRPNESRSK